MTRLCPFYSLCPLIDHESLLGVTEDSSSDCVVVTIGSKIVISYKLSNQKQIRSWSTKKKLSSPVIYDNVGNQYFAVFDKTQVRMWTEHDENLEKVKKIKFQEQVHCVLPQRNGDEPLIVFNSGIVKPLSIAREILNTDHQPVLSSDDVIEDCNFLTHENCNFVTLLTRNSSQEATYHVVPLSIAFKCDRIKITREGGEKLIGQTLIHETRQLLSLWSDGKIYSMSFLSSQSPGTYVNSVDTVSTKHPVAMTPLSSTHIVMYGADPSEEGAVLLIYHLRSGKTFSQHKFKLFASPPRLWSFNTNLLIATTHNLVVVPYNYEPEKLSDMVGVNCNTAAQSTHESELLVQSSDQASMDTSDLSEEMIEKAMEKQLKTFEADGCPQAMMIEILFPQFIETESVSELLWCFEHFTDIPERLLVKVLLFCLKKNADTKKEVKVNKLLDAVISASFSDACLVPQLRMVSFPQAIRLLRYLADQMVSDESQLDVRYLFDWTNVLLDAHYQSYLLYGDPEVSSLLCRLREFVVKQVEHFGELEELYTLLEMLQKGKVPMKKAGGNKYSIHPFDLY